MKTALVISSFVAASRVGASASAFCLRRMGIEAITLPTTVLGRHPGWGAPGGGPVAAATLKSMWESIKAQNIKIDAVLTGYMASPDHVHVANGVIHDVCTVNKDAMILVDPVMGDDGRLYVAEDIAQAIRRVLVPAASIITPNVWELGYLTDSLVRTQAEIFTAAKALHGRIIVTSVPDEDNIGAAIITNDEAIVVSHKRFGKIPHGGGDTLAACVLGHRLNGDPIDEALSKAVASVFKIISSAVGTDAGELPLVRMQDAIVDSHPLTAKRHTL